MKNYYDVICYNRVILSQAASLAVSSLGVSADGWTVVLDDSGILTDGSGLDYIFDLVSELELCPAFPMSRSTLFKGGVRTQTPVEIDHHVPPTTLTRPQVNIINNIKV